jgi:UDP-N-acetylmuramoyl-tripeptide--D-alanyl-D-alanine ligase
MSWLKLRDIADMTGGRLVGEDAPVESVCTDTRQLTRHQLFVALKGPRFDAHDFIDRDPTLLAAGLMVSRELRSRLPQILVDDSQWGLSRFAEAWRERQTLTVIGLTGSNGKTTVKEMIAAILARTGNVLATRGNLNNQIGVPLTLLSIRPQHEFAVVELGANHPGEIGGLTDIVRPDIALITNAAAAHLEGFRTLEGVAQAKAEIFLGLDKAGCAVLNADDAYADFWRQQTAKFRCVTFGLVNPADVSAAWRSDGTLDMHTPLGTVEICLPLEGRHNVMNALAATAAALLAGANLEHVKVGLEAMRPIGGRLVAKRGIRRAHIIDDTYNANPGSLSAALSVLSRRAGEHWLVLGDMAELGDMAQAFHRQVGEIARRHRVSRLYALGSLTRAAVEAFGEGATHYADVDSLVSRLKVDLHAGVNVLVKGSRSMHMESIVETLLENGVASGRGKGSLSRAEGREHAA